MNYILKENLDSSILNQLENKGRKFDFNNFYYRKECINSKDLFLSDKADFEAIKLEISEGYWDEDE